MCKHYEQILETKGLVGLWKERRAILDSIRSLTLGMFTTKGKILSERDLIEALPNLESFKKILINIKYTVEILVLARTVISIISRAAFIPICTAVPRTRYILIN